MIMKKLILFVVCVFFTYTTFSQSERDQKIQKRVERDNPRPPSPNSSTPPVVRPPTQYYNPYYNPYFVPYPTFYGRNRWDNRRFHEDRRVYTQTPVVVNRREQQQTFALGIISSVMVDNPSTLGVRMNVGGKQIYAFGSLAVSSSNPYSHYDNITLLDVSIWGDEFKFNFNKTTMWDVGVGMRINDRVYPTVSIGSTNVRTYMVHYDDLGALSNNGFYSINGPKKQTFSLTGGVDFHINNFVIINTGIGLSGPPKLVLGIQLKL